MNITLQFTALFFLSLFVSFLVSLLMLFVYDQTNYIQYVQKEEMKVDAKTLISSVTLSVIVVSVLWYCIISQQRGATDAFILGIVMTAYSEFTAACLFNNWPLHVAIIDTLAGGSVFAVTTVLYNALFRSNNNYVADY